ncbi:hypothetical protein CEE36_03525 [candidate division TA06 bacterium B3_TA06]|uniref:Uncharacterized protein n=1 Tax=candidate division TA06 bacterium B3_TA06 TaxID=2012487 RepID=A0A532V896_UNCT6|nr:MAG: hypothetical protein CEE36_03525 [candidate division TA06 bacterium B3_TA06]
MDANLFTAYNYLSSAIAQAFAALIVVTGIFFFSRKKDIEDFLNELYDNLRRFINDQSHLYSGSIPLNVTLTHGEVVSIAENILSRLSDQRLKKNIEEEITKHKQASDIKDRSRKRTMYSVIISSVAMTFGLVALLVGPILCDKQKWVVMGIELGIGLFALSYALVVIWKLMIKKIEVKIPT